MNNCVIKNIKCHENNVNNVNTNINNVMQIVVNFTRIKFFHLN